MKFDMRLSYQERGDKILHYVRKLIETASNNDEESFFINRWIFARLQQDERDCKKGIKNQLYDESSKCYVCGKKFKTIKGVHLHRLESKRGYHKDNCVLTHDECHRSLHTS